MDASNAKEFLPLVQALAEGKVIQIDSGKGTGSNGWINMSEVSFNYNDPKLYRVKPTPKWYRVAMVQVNNEPSITTTADNEAKEKQLEASGYFLKWLTDRVEY